MSKPNSWENHAVADLALISCGFVLAGKEGKIMGKRGKIKLPCACSSVHVVVKLNGGECAGASWWS